MKAATCYYCRGTPAGQRAREECLVQSAVWQVRFRVLLALSHLTSLVLHILRVHFLLLLFPLPHLFSPSWALLVSFAACFLALAATQARVYVAPSRLLRSSSAALSRSCRILSTMRQPAYMQQPQQTLPWAEHQAVRQPSRDDLQN